MKDKQFKVILLKKYNNEDNGKWKGLIEKSIILQFKLLGTDKTIGKAILELKNQRIWIQNN